LKTTAASSPYAYTWDTTGATNGTHVILARAYDNAGNSATAVATVIIDGAVVLPEPTLKLPEYVSVAADITAEYPPGYALTGFEWTITPEETTAAVRRAASRAVAGAAAVNFPTTSATASLKAYSLTPGRYTISVRAVDSRGNRSPAASAVVTLVSATFDAVKVYPNPWKKSVHAQTPVRFEGLPLDAKVQIFTVSGHRVTVLDSVAGTALWQGVRNDQGDQVASGIYLYVITLRDGSGDKHRGKLAVIR
jgi:hypothetical protein